MLGGGGGGPSTIWPLESAHSLCELLGAEGQGPLSRNQRGLRSRCPAAPTNHSTALSPRPSPCSQGHPELT